MNYIFKLTEEELRYICSVIPHLEAIKYFTKNGKEFGKIKPGFRATTLHKADVVKLLFTYAHKPFISDFIDKKIIQWLSKISECCKEKMNNGEQKYIALIDTLPFSYFSDNIALYFKLSEDDIPAEYIAILGVIIKIVKENSDQHNELKNINIEQNNEINRLKECLEKSEQEIIYIKDNLTKMVKEIENNCKIDCAQVEILKKKSQENEQKYEAIQNENKSYLLQMSDLETKLAEAEKMKTIFLDSKDVNKVKSFKFDISNIFIYPKKPKDMTEFKEYLGNNLDCFRISTSIMNILIEYLSQILFSGVPIVVNRLAGINLARCVANTLINKPSFDMLTYDKDISIDDVKAFVSSSDRVICLDNFIGNFNETLLIPIISNCANKIIFMTMAYDGTMRYISKEILKYVNYLNVNRIPGLNANAKISEDPSIIEEIEHESFTYTTNDRFSGILQVIMEEVGYPQSVIKNKMICVFDEEILCQILAFDVLPYCVDVLQINPFDVSERLVKYAGDSGRCPYKQLFKEWFNK